LKENGMTLRLIALSAFLAAQAAQLYFIGFLQNWTPKGIDTGTAASAPRAAICNCLLLALFGLAHSLMARPAFKQRLRRIAPKELERSIYILVSGMQLAMIVVLWTPMPAPLWTVGSRLGMLAVLSLFALGNLLLIWAIHSIDQWHFYGLRQAFSRAAQEPPFSMRGPYRHVRHPIQTGLIIAFWATPSMTVGHALLAGFLSLYSVIATLVLEERDLVNAMGDAYCAYRSKVPALIPFSIRSGETRSNRQ
jgi:protein-S-isoprenylcysteine O-methyltransferase Ste14